MNEIYLDFYGVGVLVESRNERLVQLIRHDFSFFEAPQGTPDLSISWEESDPDYDSLPVMKASLATPRNICFEHERTTYIDYFGRALNVYSSEREQCRIHTGEIALAHEIAYMSILSRVSEMLDRRHLHRIHALGLSYRGRAFLVLLPCGGGKTTLAMHFLNSLDSEIKLLSEDSPLIDARGDLHPFPIRIGVLSSQIPPGIDESWVHEYQRMEFSPKWTIDLACFKDRICREEAVPGMLILGERSMGKVCEIRPEGRLSFYKYSLMSSVIGVGLYQGLEYMAQRGLADSLRMGVRLLSRMNANRKLISRSKVFRFTMGRDIPRNVEALTRLIKEGRW